MSSDGWIGLGIVLIIGLIVVGFSASLGMLIIRLFGPEHDAAETSGRSTATVKPELHEAA